MNILGISILLFYFEFKFCLSENKTEKNGFCLVNYTEQVTFDEIYNHTYTKPEIQICFQGYRYYNCWRDTIKSENRTRKVHKEVPQTKVECCTGYKRVSVHKEVFDCEPICEPACIQGHCTAPGNCSCSQGYHHHHSYQCVPTCKPDCINGNCASPGHCECNRGYDKINSSYCAPHCSDKCNNGVCFEPEKCLCNPGFKQSSQNTLNCEPICENGCYNSTCTSPNLCTCWDGYEKDSKNTCTPICDLECLHGECIAPNECSCNEGYKMKNGSLNVCEPECYNCTNGFCTEPNECICFKNYTRNKDGLCEPNCYDCKNGECNVPYECECFDGYEKNVEGNCEPFCSSCDYGNCTEPNVCTCFDGYESNSIGDCFPVCEYGCGGGSCTSPGNCSCDESERIEDNFCFPIEQNTNITKNMTNNININKFDIQISNLLKTMDLSTIYIKSNCSYASQLGNFSSCEMDPPSESSIVCSLIKNTHGFKWLCIWERFSPDIRSIYDELLSTVIFTEIFNTTVLKPEMVGLTVLLPSDVTTEDGNCYICPCQKRIRFPESGTFNMSLIPCILNKYYTESRTHHWIGIGGLLLAVLAVVIIVISSFTVYYRTRRTRDYLVHTSSEQQMDEIGLTSGQEDN